MIENPVKALCALASAVLILAPVPVSAGTGSAVPAVIAAAAIVDNTTAVKGNPVTYSTQVPLSANTVYYVYVKVQPGTFNGPPNPATVFTSNNAVLQTALQTAAVALSTDKSFAVFTLGATGSVVPVNSTISFTPQGVAGNDGSINNLYTLLTGGLSSVSSQVSIGSSMNLTAVLSDIDTPAGGNIILVNVPTCKIALKAGYWWNPTEPGRGYLLEQQANAVYFSAFMYAGTGRAIWYQSLGALLGTSASTGAICTFAGSLNQYSNGQTLGGPYVAPAPSTSVGAISISFLDNAHATVTWPGATTNIQRFPIVSGGFVNGPTSGQAQTGFWWNPAEAGRGYGMEVQGNQTYFAAFMYDGSGSPTWYLSGPGGTADAGAYFGNLVQYGGGQQLNGSFHSASVAIANAGAVTLQFTTTANGVMTYPNGSQVPIQRYDFLQAGNLPAISVVVSGNGAGTVTSSPAGINCGAGCTQTYAVGTQVTLTANPAAGETFGGWNGPCSGTGTCVITVGPNVSVGAVFAAGGSDATIVNVTGPGTVSSTPAGITCTQTGGAQCGVALPTGNNISLTAVPNSDGASFGGWFGDCAGSGLALTCTLSAARTHQARALFFPATAIPDNGGTVGLAADR